MGGLCLSRRAVADTFSGGLLGPLPWDVWLGRGLWWNLYPWRRIICWSQGVCLGSTPLHPGQLPHDCEETQSWCNLCSEIRIPTRGCCTGRGQLSQVQWCKVGAGSARCFKTSSGNPSHVGTRRKWNQSIRSPGSSLNGTCDTDVASTILSSFTASTTINMYPMPTGGTRLGRGERRHKQLHGHELLGGDMCCLVPGKHSSFCPKETTKEPLLKFHIQLRAKFPN